VFGGWINVPEAIAHAPVLGWLPSSEWLHEWLHPVAEAADHIFEENVGELSHHAPFGGGEALWAALSFALATAVIVLTTLQLRRRRFLAAAQAAPAAGFTKVLLNKWYVDEAYDAVIIRPIIAMSRGFWRLIDQGLIDGAVNGLGYASRAFGWVGSRLQTGQLNTYAFAAVLGALLLLMLVAGG
jgi:NADH-quinone oxidoreductase subunit L